MASLLLVGGDKLGGIPDRLKDIGFSEVVHITGRKVKMVKHSIPDRIDFILVLTDFVNHNLASKIKERAAKQQIPVCYSRRSWGCIYKSLTADKSFCHDCPFLRNL